MFDTPDLAPLCVSPFVATIAVILVYVAARIIGKQRNHLALLLSIIIFPFACIASIALGIGEIEPRPWFTPAASDVIGTWEIAPYTKDFLEDIYEVPVLPHKVVFESDGTFFVTDVPTFWGLWDEEQMKSIPSYVTGKGKWSFDQIEGTYELEQVVVLKFQVINNSPVTSGDEHSTVTMYFVGYLPPYILKSLNSTDLSFSFQRN